MITLALGLAIASIFLTLTTAVFSILAYTEVMSMKKSTHKIEYTPIPLPSNKEEAREEEKRLQTQYGGLTEDLF